MPDYLHHLEFGTFITPSTEPATTPVALAQLSEKLGFDLVTFQDHPYQPAHLDAWTLLTWVAAQTQRIRVSGNVLNVPLRPPAVLARAAVSLDRLSGGRFDLALGAGGFWDAIEAMGGRRLAPGQAVQALEEAIDVIRGIWDADNRAPLQVDGEFHRVRGAKRGPAAAHDIPIWIGAYKPRMQRLVGRKADGWLPSLSYLKPGDLAAGNAMIDEAAIGAGRDPREIRRILNLFGRFDTRTTGQLQGPVDHWLDVLVPLAVQDGIGTFVLGSDDPRTLQTFAEEVIPALRTAVAAERGPTHNAGKVRSVTVRGKRREGIDYDALPAGLADAAIEPGDSRYSRVRSTYLRGGSPGLVLQVESVDQVGLALAFARRQNVPLAVRSGGHGISGRSTNDGGIVIDLSRMNGIEVLDEATRRVRIGPGARWMDVASALAPHGWALSSGDYGGVGVGGLATAGGIGWLVRQHGLTIDHLRAVEIVLADGTLARATATENSDLFWAVRGAGANFGIVTSFEFEVDEVGRVGWAHLVLDASDTAGFLQRWGQAQESAPRDLTSFLIMGRPRPGQPQVATVLAMVDSEDPETIVSRLQPLADAGPLLDQSVTVTTYAEVMANASSAGHNGQGEPAARSGLINHITPAFADAVARMIDSGAVYFFQIRAVGAAVADVDPADTAYANRSANFSVTALGADAEKLNRVWDELHSHFDGLYLSFDTDLRAARLADAFPPATMAKLSRIKSRLDPDNVFRDNFNLIREQALTG